MSMPTPTNPTSHRYRLDSILFAQDGRGVMIRYEDPADVGGPVMTCATELEVNLNDDEEMHSLAWEIAEAVCDLIDRAGQARRLAR